MGEKHLKIQRVIKNTRIPSQSSPEHIQCQDAGRFVALAHTLLQMNTRRFPQFHPNCTCAPAKVVHVVLKFYTIVGKRMVYTPPIIMMP